MVCVAFASRSGFGTPATRHRLMMKQSSSVSLVYRFNQSPDRASAVEIPVVVLTAQFVRLHDRRTLRHDAGAGSATDRLHDATLEPAHFVIADIDVGLRESL